jgi:hypothetical protein
MLVDPAIGAMVDTSPHGEHIVVAVTPAEAVPMEHRTAVATVGGGSTAVVIVVDMVADMVARDTTS